MEQVEIKVEAMGKRFLFKVQSSHIFLEPNKRFWVEELKCAVTKRERG
jgi:hypothetical protein